MPAVTVEHLAKSYGDTVAVRDVSFEVQRGEVFALLGPNGAGKTTTVEILEGFRHRSGGRVETLGVDPADRATQRWLRTRIGVILQELAIEPYYSVRQVLTRNAGYYPSPRPVDEVIELIGLADKADDRVKRLSGGQQRRLDVGLGIIGNPELLFLDEPTTGLDPSGRRETWDLIRRLAADGTTVLLTTHYMDEVEALANQVAVLFGQEIVASGTPSSIGGRGPGFGHHPVPPARRRDTRRVARRRGRDGRRHGRDLHRERAAGPARPHRVGAGRWPCAVGTVGPAGVAGGHLPRSDEVGRVSALSEPGVMASVPQRGSLRGWSDAGLVVRQIGFEQLSFWLNPIGALMTVVFSVVFLILLGATAGTSTVSSAGGIKLIDYYVAGFCGYGVMAACFTILAITLVNRRETGLLKRLRLSPLPTWMLMDALIINAMIVAVMGVVLLLVVGWLGYGVTGPAHWAPFVLTLLVAMVCYSAMGVGISTLVPNQDSAGPDREPVLLHPRRAVGPVVPDRAELRPGHLRRLLSHPPPH